MTTQLITRSGGASVRRSCVFTSRSRMPGSFPIIGSLGIGLLRPAWSPAQNMPRRKCCHAPPMPVHGSPACGGEVTLKMRANSSCSAHLRDFE